VRSTIAATVFGEKLAVEFVEVLLTDDKVLVAPAVHLFECRHSQVSLVCCSNLFSAVGVKTLERLEYL